MMGLYSGGMGPLGWLAAGIFWFILLALVVWLLSRLLPASSPATTGHVDEPTLEALDDQLVAGEIDLAAWQAYRSSHTAAADDSTRRSRDVR